MDEVRGTNQTLANDSPVAARPARPPLPSIGNTVQALIRSDDPPRRQTPRANRHPGRRERPSGTLPSGRPKRTPPRPRKSCRRSTRRGWQQRGPAPHAPSSSRRRSKPCPTSPSLESLRPFPTRGSSRKATTSARLLNY